MVTLNLTISFIGDNDPEPMKQLKNFKDNKMKSYR